MRSSSLPEKGDGCLAECQAAKARMDSVSAGLRTKAPRFRRWHPGTKRPLRLAEGLDLEGSEALPLRLHNLEDPLVEASAPRDPTRDLGGLRVCEMESFLQLFRDGGLVLASQEQAGDEASLGCLQFLERGWEPVDGFALRVWLPLRRFGLGW